MQEPASSPGSKAQILVTKSDDTILFICMIINSVASIFMGHVTLHTLLSFLAGQRLSLIIHL